MTYTPAEFATEWTARHVAILQSLRSAEIARVLDVLRSARDRKARVFLAGNGGSAATASHFAVDLVKGTALDGNHPVRAICLTDTAPTVTAIANDSSYDEVFSHQLRAHAEPGDVLIVFTCSGRSPNVLQALCIARDLGLETIGLLGMQGGPAQALCDVAVVVNSDDYGVIEDIHLIICHLATAYLRGHASLASGRRAVFLDRDGVLVADAPNRAPEAMGAIAPGAAQAIRALKHAGWTVVVVTNQPSVARGLISESDLLDQHEELRQRLRTEGEEVDAIFYCPHHPDATIDEYRVVCDCRKPLPGLLLNAARELTLDLTTSVMIGDQMTDIEAGHRAGCGHTILVESGMHIRPRIVTPAKELGVEPDMRAPDLASAAALLLSGAHAPQHSLSR